MKFSAFTRFGMIAHSTLLFVSLLGLGAIDLGAQMNHEGTMHSPDSQLSCQQRCTSATSVTSGQTPQEIEQSRGKKIKHSFPTGPSVFSFEMIKRITKVPSEDFRLLRPPNLLALYAILRI